MTAPPRPPIVAAVARPWRLVELCAGSAALTYHLLGMRGYQLVPFQGSKWYLRRQLAAHLVAAGFEGPPATVELSDPSFWGVAHHDILTPWRRARVIAHLRRLDKLDPREAYDALHQSEAATETGWATAQFLFLQRLAFSGKAVGTDGDVWKAQGFNKTSAYGKPGTGRFNEVKPQVEHLIRVLCKLDRLAPAAHVVRRGVARPPDGFQWRTVVYIDPPYQGTTPYPDGHMSRDEVVELAHAWQAAGAYVMVSEAGPISELVDSGGWLAWRLKEASGNRQYDEWLTCPNRDRARPVVRRGRLTNPIATL